MRPASWRPASLPGTARRSWGPSRVAGALSSRSPLRATARWPRIAARRPTSGPTSSTTPGLPATCSTSPATRCCASRSPTAATRAAELARRHGARISVDLSTWTLVDDAFRERIRSIAPDVVFANEPESDALGALAATWVVKRGAQGIVVDGRAYPAVAVTAVDATGAGDALAAGFLVGGPELGLAAAARCCAKLGAMPECQRSAQ